MTSRPTARRLLIIRHAKAVPGGPELADHDRPLAERGQADATRVGAWLASKGYAVDAALVSTSRRTRETWAGIAARLPGAPEPILLQPLFHAGPDVLLRVLQSAGHRQVAMVGHNPGLADFASMMMARAPDHPRFAEFPTGAVLVLDFPATRWAEVRPRTGEVVDFAIPADLKG